ncbi:hypothetical protein [Gordonia aichiensis]
MLNARANSGFAALVLLGSIVMTGCAQETSEDPPAPSLESATSTSQIDVDSIADMSDIDNLMAASTDVFTGRVTTTGGTHAEGEMPETQFYVDPTRVLKGDLKPGRAALINQQGGVKDDVYYSVNGARQLEVGKWYLFAARHLPSRDWYTVVPVYGHKPITEAEAKNTASAPVAAATKVLKANPSGTLKSKATEPTTTPTLPTPSPGEEHPPSSPAPTR